MTKARVVFVPGMMGSGLFDPSVPKDECRRILRDGRLARKILAILPDFSLPLRAMFATAVCKLDPRQVWGANGIALWVLDPDGWERRLTSGDGFRQGGGLRPGLPFRIRLPRVHIEPYEQIRNLLSERNGREHRGIDLLVFTYDWRLDIAENAGNLAAAIHRRWWRGSLPARVAEEDRVLIMAHSMGGLLARYYIEHLGGYRTARHLFTAGTPHRGAALAYAILTGMTAPFGRLAETGRADELLAGVAELNPALFLASAAVGDELLPPDAHLRIFRHCSSGLQLLPSVPFVDDGSGRKEPPERTLAGFRHPPTSQPATGLLRRLHDALVPASVLPTWLNWRRVGYTLLASDGTPTMTGVRRTGSGGTEPVVDVHGDGVVPIISAQLRPDVVGHPPVRTPVVSQVAHQALFKDDRVLAHCRDRLREHAGMRLAQAATGPHAAPALIELARTFPEARGRAVVSAVRVALRGAQARELLGVQISQSVVAGRPVRNLANPIPGTTRTVQRLPTFPGRGGRDYVYVDPSGSAPSENHGGILLLPEPNEDFIELLTWNVGDNSKLSSVESHEHHAEMQFVNWFSKQDPLRSRRIASHVVVDNTTYSPCTMCCGELARFTGPRGPAEGLAQAWIGWITAYSSVGRPHMTTTRQSLALLGPEWSIWPTSPLPGSAPFGPPAPPSTRVRRRPRRPVGAQSSDPR